MFWAIASFLHITNTKQLIKQPKIILSPKISVSSHCAVVLWAGSVHAYSLLACSVALMAPVVLWAGSVHAYWPSPPRVFCCLHGSSGALGRKRSVRDHKFITLRWGQRLSQMHRQAVISPIRDEKLLFFFDFFSHNTSLWNHCFV